MNEHPDPTLVMRIRILGLKIYDSNFLKYFIFVPQSDLFIHHTFLYRVAWSGSLFAYIFRIQIRILFWILQMWNRIRNTAPCMFEWFDRKQNVAVIYKIESINCVYA